MFAGTFVIFALFAVVVQFLVNSVDRESFDEDAIRAKERYEILKKVQDENNGLTSGYGWADRAKGTVRIPLDRAMELAVARLSAQGEPRPAGAIDPNVPHASAVKPGGLAAPQPTPPPFNAAASAVPVSASPSPATASPPAPVQP